MGLEAGDLFELMIIIFELSLEIKGCLGIWCSQRLKFQIPPFAVAQRKVSMTPHMLNLIPRVYASCFFSSSLGVGMEIGFFCVVLIILELALWTRPALNSQSYACSCLPSAGIKHECHHRQTLFYSGCLPGSAAHGFAKLASQHTPALGIETDTTVPNFLCGSGDENTCPRGCVTSTLLT